MALRDFLTPEARARAADAVGEVEKQTSAEIVVAVRRVAGDYRAADYLCGALAGFAALLVLLFHPRPFAVSLMPLDVAVAFALGAVLCARVAPLRRLFTRASRRRASVGTAARAAFVELGVSHTRGRTGVLVFVALFERRVEVVPDAGVRAADLGAGWTAACAALEASVAGPRPEFEAFLAALRGLGPALAPALPRAEDDVDELPNTVSAA